MCNFFNLSSSLSCIVSVLKVLNVLEHVVISLVEFESFVLEMNDFLASGVKEATGVRHDNNSGLFKLLNVFFKPDQGWQIQMICGFIEHEDLRLTEDDLRDSDSHSPTTRELTRSLGQIGLSETNTSQNRNGFCLCLLSIDHVESF